MRVRRTNKDIVRKLAIKILGIVTWLILPVMAIYADDTTNTATSVSSTIDFTAMLTALKSNVGAVLQFVIALSYVMGVWFVYEAIMELKKVGQSQMAMQAQGTLGGPLVKLIIGIVLIYLPNTVDVGVWTLWGHSAFDNSVMAYSVDTGDPFGQAKAGAIALIRVVGYVSFVRGLVILSRSGDQGSQPGTVGKGVMYIIGGILAINIVETIAVITNSLGFNVFS